MTNGSESGDKIRVGVSRCLLGDNVRYDGGHRLDRYLRDTLGRYLEYVPVCPEVECGLPVPRPAMRLVGTPEAPRLVTIRDGVDHTEQMLAWARRRVTELEAENLCGFIFKRGSPSSGMERVKVYSPAGMPSSTGVGLFARAFMEHFPGLPVEEEGRLHDPVLRENFIERLFALRRWREARAAGRPWRDLVDFHARNKLLLMAHSIPHLRELGRVVARAADLGADESFDRYEELLLKALSLKATAKKNANVLQHALGYFKKLLTPDEKQELLELIDRYRVEQLPLIVPLTLLNHYVRKYDVPYLAQQTYLNPHPAELQLRNHG
ncbi:MAG: YbgA family protein [Deferrisomatales bacterium]